MIHGPTHHLSRTVASLASAFTQSSTAGYFGDYVMPNLAGEIAAAGGAFPSSISAFYELWQGETSVADLIDLGGKGQLADSAGHNATLMTDKYGATHSTFEDVDGFEIIATANGERYAIILEDGGNYYGERSFIAKMDPNATMDYKFIMMSGGAGNSRTASNVGVPAGTNAAPTSHEFSGTIDLSGMLVKDSFGNFLVAASDDGYVKRAAEATVSINDKYIVIGLQAHSLTGGVNYYLAADRGGQWLLYRPYITAGDATYVLNGSSVLDPVGERTTPFTTSMADTSMVPKLFDMVDSGMGEGGVEYVCVFTSSSLTRVFAVNAGDTPSIDSYDLTSTGFTPRTMAFNFSGSGFTPQSCDVNVNGVLVVAAQNNNDHTSGAVYVLGMDGSLITSVLAGALPDSVKCTSDGSACVSANEGEPDDDVNIDPVGSITVVTASAWTNASSITSTTYTLDGVVNPTDALSKHVHQGLTGVTFDQDLEPEFIGMSSTTTSTSGSVYASLQENNAIIEFDMASRAFTRLIPLGFKNLSIVLGDYSDKDDTIDPKSWSNVYSMYQPDTITVVTQGGKDYLLMANEGDSKDYDGGSEEDRCKDLALDPTVFPDAAIMQTDDMLGRMKITYNEGLDASTGLYTKIVGYGGRSWSILDLETGAMAWDSEDQIPMIEAQFFAAGYQSQGSSSSFDSRSDDKGAEPEGIEYAVIGDVPYVIVSLERTSILAMWDVSNITQPTFVGVGGPVSCNVTAGNYQALSTDPEVIKFIPAVDSPTGEAIMVVAGSVTGTVTAYHFASRDMPPANLTGDCMLCYQNQPASCGVDGVYTTLSPTLLPTYVLNGSSILDPVGERTTPFTTSMADTSMVPKLFDMVDSGMGEGGVEYVCVFTSSSLTRVFAVNAGDTPSIDSYDLTSTGFTPRTMAFNFSGSGFTPQSCDVNVNGVLVVAAQNNNDHTSGAVYVLGMDGSLITSVLAGALPDSVKCTSDGSACVSANEGEPDDDVNIDPVGSITVVTASAWTNASSITSTTYTLDGVVNPTDALSKHVHQGLTGVTFDQDLEPEFIGMSSTTTSTSGSVYASLQENNAIIEFDMASRAFTRLIPLGFKNLSIVLGDYSDKDDTIDPKSWSNVYSMYQPDTITVVTQGGKDYLLMANEGDSKDYDGGSEEDRCKDLALDPTVFPDAAIMQTDDMLGRMKITYNEGLDASTGLYTKIVGYGGRSWSILDLETGAMAWDSEDQIPMIEAQFFAAGYQSQGSSSSFDSRSDDKGAEPEGIEYAVIGDVPYVIVSLERTSILAMWDVSNITQPTFVGVGGPVSCNVTAGNYQALSTDPEVIKFIPAVDSPTGEAIMVVAGSVTGTVTAYHFASRDMPPANLTGDCMLCYQNQPASCGVDGVYTTLSPTLLPTSTPGSPTAPPTPVVRYSVSASVTMGGMDCADYGTVEETAFVSGIAASLDGVDTDHIGDTECSNARRVLREDPSATDADTRRRLSSSASIAFDISIAASDVADDSVTDGSSLASSISDSLATAISSGSLTSAIAAAASDAGSTAFAAVTVTGHSISTQSPSPAPTLPAQTPVPSEGRLPKYRRGAVASGVTVLLIVFLFCGIAGGMWYMLEAKKQPTSEDPKKKQVTEVSLKDSVLTLDITVKADEENATKQI